MPKRDHEIIAAVLGTIKVAQDQSIAQRLEPRPGKIEAVMGLPITSPEAAWSVFMQFNGPGWLQNALTQEIWHGDGLTLTGQLLAVSTAKHWPVAGERASDDGPRSLSLRRTAGGWVITALEEAPDANGLLLTQRLLSTNLQQYLVYHVAYHLEPIGEHLELRPFASRFVGFEPAAERSQP